MRLQDAGVAAGPGRIQNFWSWVGRERRAKTKHSVTQIDKSFSSARAASGSRDEQRERHGGRLTPKASFAAAVGRSPRWSRVQDAAQPVTQRAADVPCMPGHPALQPGKLQEDASPLVKCVCSCVSSPGTAKLRGTGYPTQPPAAAGNFAVTFADRVKMPLELLLLLLQFVSEFLPPARPSHGLLGGSVTCLVWSVVGPGRWSMTCGSQRWRDEWPRGRLRRQGFAGIRAGG